MSSLSEAHDAEVFERSLTVSHSVVHHCGRDGLLVSSSAGTVCEVDLSEALRSDWHDISSENVSVIGGRDAGQSSTSLQESVVDIRVSSVDQSIVVVSESLDAVEVKDDVAICVFEEVALRLLQVDEVQSLLKENAEN